MPTLPACSRKRCCARTAAGLLCAVGMAVPALALAASTLPESAAAAAPKPKPKPKPAPKQQARAAAVPMPLVLRRIAQCETGLVNGRPNWRYRSRDYATAFGIHRAAWHDYHRYVQGAPSVPERATPRQQVAVALAIWRYAGGGWSAWGCFRHNAWVRAALR